jgi:CheY-like chemotaxis protein
MLRGRGEVVLLVEDEPTVLTTGKSMLEHLGYRVLTAVNGQEALTVYAEHQEEIALVLADMIMPEMDGVDLFRALQTQDPDIKVVMMTGYPLQEETLQDLVQGVVDWLLKPLTLPQVAQVMDQALR